MKFEEIDSGNLSEVVQLAWADDVPFDAIRKQYGFSENQVKKIMRSILKRPSFRLWRRRVTNRKMKHDRCDVIDQYRFFTMRKNPPK